MMEMGMGVHGEGGGDNRIPMPKAGRLAELMADALIQDKPYRPGESLLILVNGTGAATAMELNILYNELEKTFRSKGFEIAGCRVGNFLTTQELAGVSVSICSVDDTMKELWERPCDCPLWVQK